MIHNLFQGQNPEYITFRFLSQQEIVIIRFFLRSICREIIAAPALYAAAASVHEPNFS